MNKVSPELYKAISSVKNTKETNATFPSDQLGINFSGDSRRLLKVLSETFSQSEADFAETILLHALSETLKVMPDVLSEKEFNKLEERIIKELGLAAYLSLRPVFPFAQGIQLPNFAEVSSQKGIILGKWLNTEEMIVINDPVTDKSLFSYSKGIQPELSVDGFTWQWVGTNVKPVYLQPVNSKNFVSTIDSADVLFIEGVGYFYREDEYLDDLKFSAYSNIENKIIQHKEFTDLFSVIGNEQSTYSIQPKTDAFKMAHQKSYGEWEIGKVRIQIFSLHNVMISPDNNYV
tara:strand:- start:1665 stop:2534 length:870 start_codon:yes stop_codon:yes gene_type:complete